MLSLVNNMSALTAENNLSNANNALNTSLQRLSSGLQINSGADNPAGLVISQEQQAQMSGLQSAITNTSNATNVVQTADGALNETNSLLLQVRGLVVSAANSGANDSNTLAADQAQIANALQTISSIATSTQFGNDQLLNGSHAVTASVQGTTGGLPTAAVQTSGTTETGSLSASATASTTDGTYAVTITELAKQATATGAPVTVTQTPDVSVTSGPATSASATSSTATGSYTASITQAAVQATATSVDIADGGDAIAASTSETLTINGTGITLNGGSGGLTAQDVANAINQVAGSTGVSASVQADSGNPGNNQIVLQSTAYGTIGNSYTVSESGAAALGWSSATNFTGGEDIAGTLENTTTDASYTTTGSGTVLTGVNGLTINTNNAGSGSSIVVNVTPGPSNIVIAAGNSETLSIVGAGGSSSSVLLQGGSSGLTGNQVVQAINQQTSSSGVTASLNSSNELVLTSNAYGSTTTNGTYSVAETGGSALGFSSTATDFQGGADVAGYYGSNVNGTGSGNVLSWTSGAANGLAVTTDPLGTAGTISVAVQAGNSGTVSAAGTVDTASGTYTANITQLATQATLEGSNLGTSQVVGANETDLLTINGVQIQLNGGAAGLNASGTAQAINQYSNQTGVTASVDTSGGDEKLKLTSTGYGSTQNITVEESGVTNPGNPSASVVGGGTGGLASATLTAGQNVVGTVTDGSGNAYEATGSGNVLTAANGLSITTDPNGQIGALTTVVTNNAMQFQVGADAGQTASVAIQNMQANAIGTGVTNSSGIVSLNMIDVTNSNQSFSDILSVVDQAISQVSNLAGNLGAFQDNTLQATAANLQSSLQNTTAANSTIRDTDFATESANFAQDQVLVQAGTQVLKDANQLPQLALTLLQ